MDGEQRGKSYGSANSGNRGQGIAKYGDARVVRLARENETKKRQMCTNGVECDRDLSGRFDTRRNG